MNGGKGRTKNLKLARPSDQNQGYINFITGLKQHQTSDFHQFAGLFSTLKQNTCSVL